MNSLEKLTVYFTRFPGIGARQAKRFAYFLLESDKQFKKELISSIDTLEEVVSQCTLCYCFYEKEITENTLCNLCSQNNLSTLLVVEKDVDVINIKERDLYTGYYFILGGLAPFLRERRKKIRLTELKRTIDYHIKNKNINEIILALSANPEGDHTIALLTKELNSFLEEQSLKISVLGRGLSTGTELEYSDEETLKNAFESRKFAK